MTVALVRSITIRRPSSESPDSIQLLRSSVTQGLISVPSTTNLLSSGVSIVEILNIPALLKSTPCAKADDESPSIKCVEISRDDEITNKSGVENDEVFFDNCRH